MSDSDVQKVLFSAGDQADLVQYRPVSRFAVFALVLGLLSTLALIAHLLWFVPLVAIAVSLAALRVTSGKSAEIAGRKLALAGLLLALFFGVWAPVRQFSRNWVVQRQARDFGEGWFQLVFRERLQEAHQLHLPSESRLSNNANLKAYYSPDSTPQKDFEDFFADSSSLLNLSSAAKQGELQRLKYELAYEGSTAISDSVKQFYQLHWEEAGQQKKLYFTLTLTRSLNQITGKAHWRVEIIEETD